MLPNHREVHVYTHDRMLKMSLEGMVQCFQQTTYALFTLTTVLHAYSIVRETSVM